jgi:hypothetical protein
MHPSKIKKIQMKYVKTKKYTESYSCLLHCMSIKSLVLALLGAKRCVETLKERGQLKNLNKNGNIILLLI